MEEPVDESIHDEPRFTEEELRELEVLAPEVHPGGRIAWENYLRCLFLLAVVSLLGLLTWRPGLVRFSMLMSLANPTRGESLEWKAVDDPLPPPPEIKRVPPPEEWRLSPAYSAKWNGPRPDAQTAALGGGRLDNARWRRLSYNPWSWRDDGGSRRRETDASVQPPQKPATAFRAGDIAAWPAQPATPAPSQPVLSAIPSLPPLPGQAAGMQDMAPAPFPSAPVSVGAEPPARPAASAPPPSLAGWDELRGDNRTAAAPSTPAPAETPAARSPLLPPEGVGSLRPEQSADAPPPGRIVAIEPIQPEEIDWKNREIAGPIPGAYLTIYPKLKFVGLCVPGQGYIRKYNQIGVPADLTSPKLEARDGRTPYGRYYIADRRRDSDGPRLFLSWPSSEDARRIGLDPGRQAEVDNAWRRQELPPQNTVAGGGVGLNGLRNWVETTEGGFTLEAPHMEEIFTALPDKAWVFIQP